MGLSETCPRPSASLLFIAYNHEAFVEEALLSALRQDVATFELVVVDDASTDRTRAILEEVLARETPPGVTIKKLYKDKNGGLIAAVNDAMAMAAGEAFVLMAGTMFLCLVVSPGRCVPSPISRRSNSSMETASRLTKPAGPLLPRSRKQCPSFFPMTIAD